MPKKEKEPEEIIKEEDEEPDLEETIDSEFIDLNQFQQFMLSSRVGAPVLNQVEVARQIIGLEQGIASEPTHTPVKEEDDPFKYFSGKQNEQPKYVADYSVVVTTEKIEIEGMGKRRDSPLDREAVFTQSSEVRGMDSQGIEKYIAPTGLAHEEAFGRKSAFEREKENREEQRKYDFKLPSS